MESDLDSSDHVFPCFWLKLTIDDQLIVVEESNYIDIFESFAHEKNNNLLVCIFQKNKKE